MVQGSRCRVAVVGGGPAGCVCAYFLQKLCDVTVFDSGKFLRTLLPTGGGRCNLAHAEFDFRELARNYPRGEKFLYSVFSRFGTAETLDFFKEIGVETYIQEDMRIFPVTDSAASVREHILRAIKQAALVKERVLCINPLATGDFAVKTNRAEYLFDKVVISTGGHASYAIIKSLGHTIVEPKKSLVGLTTAEDFSRLAGVALKCRGEDVLFTHKGISGPYVFKISSLKARDVFPYKLSFDFCGDVDLQRLLNENPHKSIKNLLAEIVPRSFAEFILSDTGVAADEKCHHIDGKTRDRILNRLQNFTVTVTGTADGGEVVTAGGVLLDEVNSRTMESKLVKGVYFAGEVLDIDGFCGGFNLQNCWSDAFVAAQSIIFELQ